MKMNRKKNGFWTLNRRHSEGFTLVELIVVIAILAILAGVGVPVYSGYIKQANMQADRTLVSEIEHALTLAGYSGTFAEGEGGYIILSVDGITNKDKIEEDSALDKAMKATFGDSYKDTLKLKHNAWGNNGILPDDETAYVVANSSYMTGNRKDALLSDVEKMTGMAQNLVTALASGGGVFSDTTLSGMFSNSEGVCVIDTTAAKYGISKDANETWEEWAAKSTDNKAAYSNLLVLTAADESEKFMTSQGTYDMTGASDMILEFSSFYAYAATNPSFSETLDMYMDSLGDVTDKDSGKTWYNDLKAAADQAGYDTYLATKEEYGQAYVDEYGFLGILAGLGNPTDEQAANIAADVSNANLFTDGIVNSMYNEYLDAVAAVNAFTNLGIAIELDQGEIAILANQEGGLLMIFNTLPVG